MSRANFQGISTDYWCMGKGKDLILIHGLATNHAFWRLDVLLPLSRQYRVTVYDLRGHGKSGMPTNGYTSRDMAEDLHHLLDHLHIDRADLIGHSFGGVIALQYAVLHPERVSSLTVADSRVRALQPTNYPRDWPNWGKARKKLEEVGLHIPEDENGPGLWLLEQLASPKWQKMRHKLKGTALFIPFGGWNGGQRTAECWLNLMRMTTARQDLTSIAGLTLERLAAIQQPTLVVYGEYTTCMTTFQALKAVLPHCQNYLLPEAGHFFPLTQPKIFVTILSRFLQEVVYKGR